ADANIEILVKSLDELEKDTADKIKEMKTENEGQAHMTAERISGDLQSFAGKLKDLPADKEKVKAMKARLDKLNADFNTVAMAQEAKQKFERLKSSWESYSNEYQGWEAETAGPTFEQYGKTAGNTDMHAFNMPRSVALISRADNFLANLDQDENYKSVAANPEVKAFV